MNNYQILGVQYNADERTIKRAYAKLIKEFRPDSHPTEFAKIRSAYEALLDDCRYRREWQYDFDDDSNNAEQQITEVINDEPIINISIDEKQENNYERLIDKPIIAPVDLLPEPVQEDSFNYLIEKPVLRDTVVEPLITEEEKIWLKQPNIDIYALIQALQKFVMPQDERAALLCFEKQMPSLMSMNLDQLMDYEERLYNYLIYHDKPALLLFAAANQYFDWQNKVSWLRSAQSQWHQQRFKALTELSVLYQQATDSYNPYFQENQLKIKRITTHYHLELKQQQRDQWFDSCLSGKLEKLNAYFYKIPLHQPIYITDMVFGMLIGGIFNYFINPYGLLIYFNLYDLMQSSQLIALFISFLRVTIILLIATFSSVLLFSILRLPNISISRILNWRVALWGVVFHPVGVVFLIVASIYLPYKALNITETAIVKLIYWLKQQQTIQTNQTIMNKQLYALLLAQFLSAFADNAILFTVIAMVMKSGEPQGWYIPALQSAFLIAYVIFAPWVGHIADSHAKSKVLMIANIIKALGAALLLFHIEPLFAYSIVGLGAAIYSPAKYGILPELVGHNELVKANSWIEGSTIMAILLGMKIGAMIADYSVTTALIITLVLFIISAVVTLILPVNISRTDNQENLFLLFGKQMNLFFTTPRSRFAVLGGSLFWAAAASLRVILIAWAALVLAAHSANEIADLTLYLTIGIIVGSIAVPRLIPLEHLRRARIPAYLMAIAIMGLSFTSHVLSAQIVLFFVGMMGGLFVVPINAVLQEHGQQTIGSGSAVALQNFFQNLAMLLAVGAYSIAAGQQINPIMAMLSLGGFVFVTTLLVSLNLPKDET